LRRRRGAYGGRRRGYARRRRRRFRDSGHYRRLRLLRCHGQRFNILHRGKFFYIRFYIRFRRFRENGFFRNRFLIRRFNRFFGNFRGYFFFYYQRFRLQLRRRLAFRHLLNRAVPLTFGGALTGSRHHH
jgi:hypothetical protein